MAAESDDVVANLSNGNINNKSTTSENPTTTIATSGGGGGGSMQRKKDIQQQQQQHLTTTNNGKNGLLVTTTATATTITNHHHNNQTINNDTAGSSAAATALINGSNNINNTINSNSKHLQHMDNSLHNFYHAPPDRRSGMPAVQRVEENDGLGPLPQKWEKAYTENGESYFIDHNTGTSHWLDPRLSKFQKKSLEDCLDDELPYGWEKIHDPQYGTYFIDHVNRRTQYENPVLEAKRRADRSRIETIKPNSFTRNSAELCGERLSTTLLKSSRGLGFTIVGGDDNVDEFLQIKSIVPNGPAWLDGKLQMGDILVYVNDICVLGFTHHEMVNVFQSIQPGETVTLEVCRGYPLPFDPNDPNTEVVTTIAVDGINADPAEKARILMDFNMDGNYNFLDTSGDVTAAAAAATTNGSAINEVTAKNPLSKIQSGSIKSDGSDNYINETRQMLDKVPEILNISIIKGAAMGFGFTIADSAYGQKVKKILDSNCCTNLVEGDYLLAINNISIKHMSHSEVVQVLKDCPKGQEAELKIQRGHFFNGNLGKGNRLRRSGDAARFANNTLQHSTKEPMIGLYRSKTPTADLYSTQTKEILPQRPKTPLVDTRNFAKSTSVENSVDELDLPTINLEKLKQIAADAKSNNSLADHDSINNDIPYMDPFPKLVSSLSDRLADISVNSQQHHQQQQQQHQDPQTQIYSYRNQPASSNGRNKHFQSQPDLNYDQQVLGSNQDYFNNGFNPGYNMPHANGTYNNVYSPPSPLPIMAPVPTYHQDACYCYECQDYGRYQQEYLMHPQYHQQQQQQQHHHHHQQQQQQQQMQQLASPPLQQSTPEQHNPNGLSNGHTQKRINDYMIDRRKAGFSPLETHVLHNQQQQKFQQQQQQYWKYDHGHPSPNNGGQQQDDYTLSEVTLDRQALGFGFRIVGGTEEGSQVTVGHIVPGGAADGDFRIATGDEILSIDGHNVVQGSHHRVVQLMGEAALRGQVTMILRRKIRQPPPIMSTTAAAASRPYPYDVIVSRNENEGFGFVISSSSQYYGSTIGKLIPGSPADRCDELRVDDRIIAVNRIDINGMSHGDVVNLIKESGLHVRLTIDSPKELSLMMNTNGENGGSAISQQQQHHQSHYQHSALQQQQQQPQNHLKNAEYFDNNYSIAGSHPPL